MREIVILAAFGIMCCAQTASPTPSTDPGMIRFFAGEWSCAGEFANGKKIAADLKFSPELDNKWLLYWHADRPPGAFKSVAMWGVDRESGKLVSIAQDIAGGVRLFTSDGWKDGAVTFESGSILDHRPSRERFRYERQSPDSFKMTYEVGTAAGWRMGDYIVCSRHS